MKCLIARSDENHKVSPRGSNTMVNVPSAFPLFLNCSKTSTIATAPSPSSSMKSIFRELLDNGKLMIRFPFCSKTYTYSWSKTCWSLNARNSANPSVLSKRALHIHRTSGGNLKPEGILCNNLLPLLQGQRLNPFPVLRWETCTTSSDLSDLSKMTFASITCASSDFSNKWMIQEWCDWMGMNDLRRWNNAFLLILTKWLWLKTSVLCLPPTDALVRW